MSRDRLGEILAGMTQDEVTRVARDAAAAANARGIELTEDAAIAATVGAFDSGNFGPDGIAQALDDHLAAAPYMTTTHPDTPAHVEGDEPEDDVIEPLYDDDGIPADADMKPMHELSRSEREEFAYERYVERVGDQTPDVGTPIFDDDGQEYREFDKDSRQGRDDLAFARLSGLFEFEDGDD